MTACIPKHIICETYIPDFTPGSTPCSMQTFNETRARLVAGGTFFRSADVGTDQNNITVECVWYAQPAGGFVITAVTSGGPNAGSFSISGSHASKFITGVTFTVTGSTGNNGTYTVRTPGATGTTVIPVVEAVPSSNVSGSILLTSSTTTNINDVESVGLTISNGPTTENYFQNQSFTTTPSPLWTSAIPGLRSQVNSSSVLISMPASDGLQPFTTDADHITFFGVTNLVGGNSAPVPSAAIRTGPTYSLIFIASSELNYAGFPNDSAPSPIPNANPKVRTWDSNSWEDFYTLPCYDPLVNPPTCP